MCMWFHLRKDKLFFSFITESNFIHLFLIKVNIAQWFSLLRWLYNPRIPCNNTIRLEVALPQLRCRMNFYPKVCNRGGWCAYYHAANSCLPGFFFFQRVNVSMDSRIVPTWTISWRTVVIVSPLHSSCVSLWCSLKPSQYSVLQCSCGLLFLPGF